MYIFLRNIYTSCAVTGVSSLTRTIPFRNIHTLCVVTRARIRRVYSYTECINAVCSHGSKDSPDRPCLVTRVSFPHRVYSFTEYVQAVCSLGGADSPGNSLWGVYIHPM